MLTAHNLETTSEQIPLSAEQVSQVFDAGEFVRNRKGKGGPQPESIKRMLTRQQEELADLRRWIENEDNHLKMAAEKLNTDFTNIAE